MKGSTKLWLAAGIIGTCISWYLHVQFFLYFETHPFADNMIEFMIALNFGSFVATLAVSIGVFKHNVSFIWWLILAPFGVILILLISGCCILIMLVAKRVTYSIEWINKWADKNLGI